MSTHDVLLLCSSFSGGRGMQRGWVLRVAVGMTSRAAKSREALLAAVMPRCCSLLPLGAGIVAGVSARRYVTRPRKMKTQLYKPWHTRPSVGLWTQHSPGVWVW